MGWENTQVCTWQCWGDPSDQGNAAAGLCLFHFIQCLLEWGWILHPAPASGKMFPLTLGILSQLVLALGEVAVWGQCGIALPCRDWGAGKGLSLCPLQLWGSLWESLEKLQRGGRALLVLPGRALPPAVCAAGGEEAQPHSQYCWKMAQITLCWNLMCFRGVKILYWKSVSIIRLLFSTKVPNTSTYFSKASFLLMTEMKRSV